MFYQAPSVEIIGSATDSIQGLPGIGPDAGPVTQNTRLALSSKLEEE